MSVSYWLDRQLPASGKVITKDVIIIGGGIAGLSTAYWLLKENQGLNIALLEKHEIGCGATGRNAGFITCGSVEHFNRLVVKHGKEEALAIWHFSEENLRLLKEHIIQDDEEDLLFEHKGSFSLASTETEFKELQASSQLMGSMNINVEVLQEDDIKKRLGADKFVGGIKYCDDASINPIKLLERINGLVQDDDYFSLYENNEVYSIEKNGENNLVKSNKGHYEAPLVIFATNGYSSMLNDFFTDKIFPTRGQILATAPVPRFMEGPCYANFVLDYFRQLPTGELIIGGFRQLQKDVEIGCSDQTSDIIQKALEGFLHKHIPAVRQAKITHRWSGIMGFSADGQPMVGSLPEDPSLFFVGGFTAHGLGLAFHSAKTLVDGLFDRPIPEFISARRF